MGLSLDLLIQTMLDAFKHPLNGGIFWFISVIQTITHTCSF